MQGLGWLGSISVISSGIVAAQTNSSTDSVGVAPSNSGISKVKPTNPSASTRGKLPKPHLKPNLLNSPSTNQPQSLPPRSNSATSHSATSASTQKPGNALVRQPENAISPPPETSRPRRNIARVTKPRLTPPDLTVPTQASVSKPPKITINPSQRQETAQKPVNSQHNYTDRTNYRVSASGRYSKPSAVILTERTTGCVTVSRNGRLASGSCGSQSPRQEIGIASNSQEVRGRVARRRSQPTQESRQETVANRPNQPVRFRVNESTDNPSVNGAINRRINQIADRRNERIGNSRNQPLNSSINLAVGNRPQQSLTSQVSQSQPARGVKLPAPPLATVKPARLAPITVAANSIPTKRHQHHLFSRQPSVPSQFVSPTSIPIPPPQTSSIGLDYYDLTRRPVEQPNIPQTSFIFPLTIPSPITSLFGWRLHPISGDYRFHAGTDLGAPQGTPVIAAVSGEVATADYLGGYGLAIIIRHNEGTQESLYAHLSEVFVKQGDLVNQGTVIGRVGNTGFSTGPHLHFEWRQQTPNGWVAVDASAHLEYGLAQFMKALQVAKTPQPPQLKSDAILTQKIPIEIPKEPSNGKVFGEITGVETISNIFEGKK
ncbi:MAG TPA: hypothetical protein DEG17_06520 [Cyanobacteria bacterium UBA11149]|nr:hypothetical protein [Cyanobacteria bacterium UBA11367]HBE56629.1 hypothetical protein [Cyanobacteria bacterium UBA11366]HBK64940.1 hypothetical protein [Cyanobacteria bacterium UBA11166]HBR76224.1 hypothetical protein [Cyanobacteria bacterium UBA11159]HBS69780.1 hypothetical protein [Cyanobacteria bacterium UBA11153]HBW88530.1 hypothetical protein [Cyanobacteria bacterium UBA11149]HCA98256.1 hypothetical protein [Cyanobacteria bacterium UBA9226]